MPSASTALLTAPVLSRRSVLKGLTAVPLVTVATAVTSSADVTFVQPGDAAYAQHRQVFNKRIRLQPAVIAVCKTEAGVQSAVTYARERQLPIAIKSGGHGFEGYALNERGLVIDLSAMRQIVLSTDQQLTVEPGCTLAPLYDYLLPRGRLLPTGSCGGVGLAGLTLGGGYGFFSRQYGLTCDSLTRVRLVDAQGMLHDSQESPDLLWACRGGGNGHFGIVTRLHLQTHPAPATFYSTRFKYTKRTPTSAAMVVARWFALTPGLPADAFSACIISGTTVTVLVTSFQTSPDHKAMAEVLSTFRQGAEPAATTQRTPLTQAVKRYYGRQGPLYFKNVSAGFYRGFDDLQAIFQDIVQRIAVQPGMLLQINTFGGTSAMHPTPPPSAFPHRAYPFLGELQYYWDNSAHETAAMTAVQGIQRLLTQHGIRAHYSNYPDSALPNWAEAYYGRESYPRLQMLKKRYDPENHIQHPQSVRLPTGT